MAFKKWVVRSADKERASALSEKFNIDPFVAFLMVSRGISKDIDAINFLSDDFLMSSPFDFADMEKAVETIYEAIENQEKICIYGDYDCDGVTSTALLLDFFRSKGADVCYYIPSRENEGYGMNKAALDTIASWGVGLIVTVDNGINSFEEAEYIYNLGMRLVITDHHQLTEDLLPKAEAVVNPHRKDNSLEFRDYCGVGVAFKLAVAMDEDNAEELVDEYIDIVAVGTIADVMPLRDENRAIVRLGIKKFNSQPRLVFKPFVMANAGKEFTCTDIAFRICPRINAMGRMGDAKRAVELLLCDDEAKSTSAYNDFNEENSYRQSVEQEIINDVERQLSSNKKLLSSRVIVVSGDGYHHGVIGIVSAHITEKYGKPSFVIGIDENGVARGSARSIEGFNLFEAICACADDLIQYGGHPLAAGISLDVDMIDKFREDINNFANEKYPVMPQPELIIDMKLSPSYLNIELADSLKELEPFGSGNPPVILGIYKMTLLSVSSIGDGKHIRMELQKKNNKIRVVRFTQTVEDFPYQAGDILDLAVKISKNFYNGKSYLSVQAVDIRLSSCDEEKYFAQKSVYELYRSTGKVDASLYPEREDCSVVYKYLRANNGYNYSLDDLYFRLQDKISYGKLMFALKAFNQAGLINIQKKITLNQPKGKVDLEKTDILRGLKGRIFGE